MDLLIVDQLSERLLDGDSARKVKRLFYNEIIVDAVHWRAHMPDAVEAVYGSRALHQKFLEYYQGEGVTATSHPFVGIDVADRFGGAWTAPFYSP